MSWKGEWRGRVPLAIRSAYRLFPPRCAPPFTLEAGLYLDANSNTGSRLQFMRLLIFLKRIRDARR